MKASICNIRHHASLRYAHLPKFRQIICQMSSVLLFGNNTTTAVNPSVEAGAVAVRHWVSRARWLAGWSVNQDRCRRGRNVVSPTVGLKN